MITRRGFLAGTAAALLADATGPSWAQQAARTRVIDVHAHWYPPQWLELVEKEAAANGATGSSATRAATWWSSFPACR